MRRGELGARDVCGLPETVCARAEAALLAARREGEIGLAPVFEALDGQVTYEDLRCLEAGLWASGRLVGQGGVGDASAE